MTLYGTSGATGAGLTSKLYTVTDTAGFNAAPSTTTATTVSTSAADIGWRGIVFSPDDGVGAITGLAGTTNYTVGNSATLVGSAANFSDLSNFMGGKLVVSYASGGTSSDVLSVADSGTPGTGINVTGSTISYNGTTIGTINTTNNGNAGAGLEIDFNSVAANNNVLASAVQALI